jgi:hypothetical protein
VKPTREGVEVATYKGLRAPAWTLTRTSPVASRVGTGQSDFSSRDMDGWPLCLTIHAFWVGGMVRGALETMSMNYCSGG